MYIHVLWDIVSIVIIVLQLLYAFYLPATKPDIKSNDSRHCSSTDRAFCLTLSGGLTARAPVLRPRSAGVDEPGHPLQKVLLASKLVFPPTSLGVCFS